MKGTIKEKLLYGDRWIDVSLPERTRVIRAQPDGSNPPIKDLGRAIREAIANPIAHDPLPKLVGKGAKVTIAFDDPGGSLTKPPDFRQVAINILLEELQKADVELQDIRLLCANALHRKWTRSELAPIVGERISVLWSPQRLYCHDAEDKENLVFLGETKRGFEVEVNRAVTDSDLLIYLNITSTPFAGGWKSVAVGLSTFRGIRHHHRPFPFASGKSVMDPKNSSFQKLVWEQGAVIEKHLAEKAAASSASSPWPIPATLPR
ncbi:MAG: lactate racemase domain-containing protein [Dehalococcoidia bacterium]